MSDNLDCSSPNECSYHYKWSELNPIVLLNEDGSCPLATEHTTFGPAAG